MNFPVSVNIFFFGGCPKVPFLLTTWSKKRAPPTHYKNGGGGNGGGFSKRFFFFFKKNMSHETAIFGPNKSKFRNFNYRFFAFSLLFKQQKHNSWNPDVYNVLANKKIIYKH